MRSLLFFKDFHFVLILVLFSVLPVVVLVAQEKPSLNGFKKLEQYHLQPIIAFQLWTSYTMGQDLFNVQQKTYDPVGNRLNFQLRRSRFGLKGQFREGLYFNFTTALDLVGRDALAATQGGSNNGGSPKLRAWNVFLQWQLKPKSEAFHLVLGYFTPQIGRESITSAFRVSSMEKAWTQNYLRRHLTGTGPGRAVGINLGGLLKSTISCLNFNYNLGIFNSSFEDYQNLNGENLSPLLVGRFQIDFGQPELEKYSIVRKTNYFGKRKGLSLAIAGAQQRVSTFHNGNYAFSIDALFNWKGWNIDGEWTQLSRKRILDGGEQDLMNKSSLFHIRGSYIIALNEEYKLEPVLLFARFQGAISSTEQIRANSLFMDSGRDEYLDIGLNFYFNPKLKLSFHLSLQNGQLGVAEEGATINQFFYQNQIGAIRRGDWLGFGVVAIL